MYNYKDIDPDQIEYIPIASIDDITSGERLFVEIDNLPLVVFNIAGDLYAIKDECTHDNATLGDGDLDGYLVSCPRHGAEFDIRTGEVRSLPAVVDVQAYPTRIIDGQIEVGLPIED